MKKYVKILLTDDEMKFIQWMSERDNLNVEGEIVAMFRLQLKEDIKLFECEYRESL